MFKEFSIIIAITGCFAQSLLGMVFSLSLPGNLTSLPLEIQQKIVLALPYKDLVSLAQTSRGANKFLEERLALGMLRIIVNHMKIWNLQPHPTKVLFMAIRSVRPKFIRFLFEKFKVNPNRPEHVTELWTPLHAAVLRYNKSKGIFDKQNLKEIIQILLDNGAEPKIKYRTGMPKKIIRTTWWYRKQYLGKTPIDLATDKAIKHVLRKKSKK